MKKINYIIVILIIGMAIFSCSENWDEPEGQPISNNNEETMQRTFGEALLIAQNALEILEGNTATRSVSSRRKICIDASQFICNNNPTRSSNDIDTLMYIFNFEDSLGFAVISGNRATPDLIAITEYGYYNPTEEQKNTSFAMMMERAKVYISTTRLTVPPTEHKPIPHTGFVPAKIPVRWGQEAYYGSGFYNGMAGCGPVAIAQTLAYYKVPNKLPLTYTNNISHPDTLYLDWTEICKHKIYHETNVSDSTKCTASNPMKVHRDIGYLMRQIGEITEKMDDSLNYTTIKTNKIPYCLTMMGLLHSTFQAYGLGCTETPLEQNHIILITGKVPEKEHGHVFLVDGYLRLASNLLENPIGYMTTYNHVNWGWDGANDGYYIDGIFDLGNPFQLDGYGITTDSTSNYTDSLAYIDIWK